MDPAGFEPAASLSQPKGLRPFRNPRRPAVAQEHMKNSYKNEVTKQMSGPGGI